LFYSYPNLVETWFIVSLKKIQIMSWKEENNTLTREFKFKNLKFST